MNLKIFILSLLTFILFAACYNGEDVKGKIVIEYNGEWTAMITEDYNESSCSGNGASTFNYTNPDRLKITASKLDSTLNKLIIYIYEDERIAAEGSTREPQGSANASYEFPY